MDVSLTNLSLDRSGRRVLGIPTLDFPSGSVTAVFGPNGSGKTTLLRCMAGLEHPGGSVRIGDRAVQRGDMRVAIAFQEPVFVRGSVRENLALGLGFRGVTATEQAERIRAIGEECGLGHVLERPASALSSGEAQRASLARALALSAPVTLLDEPLSGFDRIGRIRMLEEIPALLAAHASTAIIVTHDREEAFRLADRLVLLVGGRVTACGPAGAIYRAPPDVESARLLGYTVISHGGRAVGFPPGALRKGPGPVSFALTVAREVDMGSHRHLIGRVVNGGDMAPTAELRLDHEEAGAEPGTELVVHPAHWIEFPGPGVGT